MFPFWNRMICYFAWIFNSRVASYIRQVINSLRKQQRITVANGQERPYHTQCYTILNYGNHKDPSRYGSQRLA